jgi:sulfur-carrier protein
LASRRPGDEFPTQGHFGLIQTASETNIIDNAPNKEGGWRWVAAGGDDGGMVTVRFYAGARAAAGVTEEGAEAATLNALLDHLAAEHQGRLNGVLPACSFLVDGIAWHDPEAPLPPGATVDVLPPFAGG